MEAAPSILVVDDELINRKILGWALSEAGFHVLQAANGAEARRIAEANRPDLIILDILMPGEDGYATCQLLQSSPATRDIPIIFISGLTETDQKVRGLGSGAVDYITKPFAGEEVVARVRIHLRLRRANHALIAEQAAKLSHIRQAQQAILVNPQDLPAACFAVRFLTVHEAGGDFYDVFASRKNMHSYFVADITGHDLGASFMTPALKTLIRQNAGPLDGPVETFTTMNGVLRQVLSPGQVLTAAYLTVNRKTGSVQLVRAGHPQPILVRAGGKPELLEPEGDVLGGFDNAFFEVLRFTAQPGDRLFLYTDGLVESPTRSFGQGQDELLHICASVAGFTMEEALDALLRGMLPPGKQPADDVVLLGVEV
jgi:phosphoserine phosphatase RsbU/P